MTRLSGSATGSVRRQIPQWRQLRQLVQVQRPRLARSRRVAEAPTIRHLRALSRARAPRAVFDYTDGAAEGEVSLERSRDAYRKIEFRPRVLRDVSSVSASVELLGSPSTMPFALSPTGFTRMMHTEGEIAVARAAHAFGVPYTLSTLGTTSIEDLARAVPGAERWFQLYVWKDRSFSQELVERARASGYRVLVLTVDVPVAGSRLRDIANGLTIPPKLTLRTLLDGALHPAWWWDLVTTEPLRFATLSDSGGTVADLIDRVFDPGVGFDDVAWLKSIWPGPVIVKGVQTPGDALMAAERGADAVIVSNHGGRQLDRAPVTLEVLPDVVRAVGDRAEVYVDGGVMSGADIAAAVALGADAVMAGRAYLYGLMAGGEMGVRRAIEILEAELTRTLQLLGVVSTRDLNPSFVVLRDT
jgi:L-lactate dehydrogenase (cytochrome)